MKKSMIIVLSVLIVVILGVISFSFLSFPSNIAGNPVKILKTQTSIPGTGSSCTETDALDINGNPVNNPNVKETCTDANGVWPDIIGGGVELIQRTCLMPDKTGGNVCRDLPQPCNLGTKICENPQSNSAKHPGYKCTKESWEETATWKPAGVCLRNTHCMVEASTNQLRCMQCITGEEKCFRSSLWQLSWGRWVLSTCQTVPLSIYSDVWNKPYTHCHTKCSTEAEFVQEYGMFQQIYSICD
jgi:hypothetical protein